MIRSESRLEFSEKINGLSKSDLWTMGISRVSEVSGFDVIGVRTWTSERPLSETISINSGKSLNSGMARAGAILEAAEYHAGENPWGDMLVAPYCEVKDKSTDYRNLPLIKDSVIHEEMPIEWEISTEILSGTNRLIPSAICWMIPRSKTYISHFQNSSNGVASGYSIVDAIISGLYEVIERDARTIAEHLECQRLLRNTPDRIKDLEEMARRAGLKLAVFSCTQDDIPVHTFGAIVYGDNAGVYSGHGTDRCPAKAMTRAVLEAYQSRCVYIAGARDDLFRRGFLVSKHASSSGIQSVINRMKIDESIYSDMGDIEDSDELKELCNVIKNAGFNEILVKHLNTIKFADVEIPIVKVVIPGMETCRLDGQWSPSPRCIKKKSLYTSAQA